MKCPTSSGACNGGTMFTIINPKLNERNKNNLLGKGTFFNESKIPRQAFTIFSIRITPA